ncbi:MAG: hypothetical protein QF444_06470, partial [Phycisphaerales bacterium]|nr:hypothetical protein [Phycisphaerales bacterium]
LSNVTIVANEDWVKYIKVNADEFNQACTTGYYKNLYDSIKVYFDEHSERVGPNHLLVVSLESLKVAESEIKANATINARLLRTDNWEAPLISKDGEGTIDKLDAIIGSIKFLAGKWWFWVAVVGLIVASVLLVLAFSILALPIFRKLVLAGKPRKITR